MTNPQAGWYADPSGDAAKLRYWNGEQWTDDYADAQPAGQEPTYGSPAPVYPQASGGQAYYPQTASNDSDRTLRLVAFILCIVSTVSVCWLIIPLAWMIPMSIRCWNIYKGTKPNTTAFGVCTLIFVTLIGGILLLVSKKDA
ncbi:DUF2510 domain-containing protein [Paraeggerthella sp. Marseille-Q4926]|jgi:hypothetical protein|uniref:DUF2510 domain-containing protein n=1 Tax=unclassified Paraeggerthella TaxID=2641972 RepID=UPI001CE49DBD|nr:DUF2510 domain-containing protein [Paraeggerthella sp. Marseille-Q4926]